MVRSMVSASFQIFALTAGEIKINGGQGCIALLWICQHDYREFGFQINAICYVTYVYLAYKTVIETKTKKHFHLEKIKTKLSYINDIKTTTKTKKIY